MWPSLYPPVSLSKLTRKGAGALLTQPDPLGQWLRFSIRRLIHDVAHLPHVGHGDFAPAQAADEVEHRRPLRGGIHRRAHLSGKDTAQIWRAEGEVAVDDAHSGKPPQAFGQLLGRKRPEPAHAHKPD